MPTSLIDKLFSISEKSPEKEAIASKSESITFASLAADVRSLGTRLSARSGKQSRAVLVIENSIEYVIALYSCWYAGLIAVPIDANSKDRELSKVVEHAKPSIIISSADKGNAVAVAEREDIEFVDIFEESRCRADSRTATSREAQDALIIYTSGTSGNPKGVVLTHDNLVANAVSIIDYLELSGEDSTVVVLPFHYS